MAGVLPFKLTPFEVGAQVIPAARRVLLGDVLVRAGMLDAVELEQALEQQRHQDQRLGHILVTNRAISQDDLLAALSQQSKLGRIDLAASPADGELVRGCDPYRCLELGAVPWRQFAGTRVIAISNPDNAAEAMETLGGNAKKIALALASPDDVRRTVTEACRAQLRDDAGDRCPEAFSCRTWTEAPNQMRRVVLAGMALAGIAMAPLLALQALMAWILLANSMTMGLRLVALFARHRAQRNLPVHLGPRLADYKKLPRVSILVPLLREEAVARQLLDALAAMDYPEALLDIKLVLEEHDEITRAAIERADLPPTIDVISVPSATLRTKPRAMNFALPLCDGDIVGVYDAEDRPDPAQIRTVVEHLQHAPPEVACVQGYLDFYNPTQNWLARCFTLEYAIWFRVILHGVQKLGFPIPLGGTSVFFRRNVLEAIGAWDAHNVTEDADLGMRLARFGYRCEMIPSITLEEANCRLVPWIKQRSRWLKGYAVTWATHMQRPGALFADLGFRGFLGFQILFLGAITSYLSIPLFWLIWSASAGFGVEFWRSFPDWLMWSFFASMIAGQALMFVTAVMAARDCDHRGMWRWALIMPFYWPLGALAAYRAVGELVSRPSFWHKTEHGIAADRGNASAPAHST